MNNSLTGDSLSSHSSIVVPSSPSKELLVRNVCQDIVIQSTRRARAMVAYNLALELGVLPLRLVKNQTLGSEKLEIVVTRRLDPWQLQELRGVSGVELKQYHYSDCDLRQLIFEAYFRDKDELLRSLQRAEADTSRGRDGRGDGLDDGKYRCVGSGDGRTPVNAHRNNAHRNTVSSDAEDGSAIVGYLNSLLAYAIACRASDVHLSLSGGETLFNLRVDGCLRSESDVMVSGELFAQLVRRLKILTGVAQSPQGTPFEGAFLFVKDFLKYRVRVSILPQVGGEKVVLRLLNSSEESMSFSVNCPTGYNPGSGNDGPGNDGLGTVQPLIALGMTSLQADIVLASLAGSSGVVLLSGATGSGKSTLLHTLLKYVRSNRLNIVSIEDPVERVIAGVTQIEVNREKGWDFDTILPKVMRQDPDIIAVGEVRDLKTCETTLTAGITGHLVFSTLHASSAFEALIRLRQLGVSPEMLTSAIKLVIWQRLVPLNCRHCVQSVDLGKELASVLRISPEQKVRAARGCEYCGHTGVASRIGCYEVMGVPLVSRQTIAEFVTGVISLSELGYEMQKNGVYSHWYHSVKQLLLSGLIAPCKVKEVFGLPTSRKQ